MALYPHVGSKAALLDGMVGSLLSELRPPDSAGPRSLERLRALARSARTLVHRHPWASALLFSRPALTPDAVSVVDQINAVLLEAGVPAPEVPRLERLVSTVILGFAASEVGGRFRGPEPGHRGVDWDAEFDADVEDLLRLIELAAAEHPQCQA
jgi:AcrR family transcriptional regulator